MDHTRRFYGLESEFVLFLMIRSLDRVFYFLFLLAVGEFELPSSFILVLVAVHAVWGIVGGIFALMGRGSVIVVFVLMFKG